MSNILDSNYENPIDSPGFLLWQVTNLWQKKIKSTLKTLDLTHVQFVLLAACSVLDDTNEQITQTDLSQFTKTDVMMTSQVLRTLENKGLVERKTHPFDTRAKVLHVTDKGRELAKEANKLVEDTDKKFFLKLEDNQHTFTLLLQELSQND